MGRTNHASRSISSSIYLNPPVLTSSILSHPRNNAQRPRSPHQTNQVNQHQHHQQKKKKKRIKMKSKKVPAWMILQDPSCTAYVSPRLVLSILPMLCQHPLKHPSLTRSIQRIPPGGEEKTRLRMWR
ncbi:hypothetical protein P168DRAFT_43326 [Aspergillus campestris IBT 28561]|uniref:Uncharacterized protein n=1 Tax=Aspergillus campestris (strain IBT 28561) TaxID=1392248 RepID=A0A2I1CX72_ASPC2|nr:uncharacterized protein P168DRAFT_43326 [Aspergillus campestris IBT 28561]PKY02237.1 hypothetical protein P168DRAFT_43326 [Aspergillus campestris IBT 28561]